MLIESKIFFFLDSSIRQSVQSVSKRKKEIKSRQYSICIIELIVKHSNERKMYLTMQIEYEYIGQLIVHTNFLSFFLPFTYDRFQTNKEKKKKNRFIFLNCLLYESFVTILIDPCYHLSFRMRERVNKTGTRSFDFIILIERKMSERTRREEEERSKKKENERSLLDCLFLLLLSSCCCHCCFSFCVCSSWILFQHTLKMNPSF